MAARRRPTLLARWLRIFEPRLTHAALGRRLGCSARQARRYCAGQAVPRASTLTRLVALTLLPAEAFSSPFAWPGRV